MNKHFLKIVNKFTFRLFNKTTEDNIFDTSPWIIRTDNRINCSSTIINDVPVLLSWIEEIKIAQKTKKNEDWLHAGFSVVMEMPKERITEIFSEISHEINFTLIELNSDFIFENGKNIRNIFQDNSPCIVVIHGGLWSAIANHMGDSENDSDFTNLDLNNFFADEINQFNPENPVILALVTESFDLISDSLFGKNKFNRFFELGNIFNEKAVKEFCNDLGDSIVGETIKNNHQKLSYFLQGKYPDKNSREIAALQLKRIAKREKKIIEFHDIVDLSMRGMTELGPHIQNKIQNINIKKTAYHEAGHAAIAIIDSSSANVPDYASVIPSKYFQGVVMPSIEFHENKNEFTYLDLLHAVRISLAGRAAEEFFFSIPEISSGSQSDLDYATRITFNSFASYGFNKEMANNTGSGNNLAVFRKGSIEIDQQEKIMDQVRIFLEEQYLFVLDTLKKNKSFVDAIAERLCWDPIVDQNELQEIVSKFNFKK